MDVEDQASISRRRRLRKGTSSCWECRRRKIRCIYATSEDAVCIGCARRFTDCVTQDHPEKKSSPVTQARLVGDRIERMELVLAQFAKQTALKQIVPRIVQPSLIQTATHGLQTPEPTVSATVSSALSPNNPPVSISSSGVNGADSHPLRNKHPRMSLTL